MRELFAGLTRTSINAFVLFPASGLFFAAGIIAEIGTIADFKSQDAIAKYAGLVWKENQSGNFRADDTKMSKEGNRYLRYYLIEAANSVKNYNAVYNAFYSVFS